MTSETAFVPNAPAGTAERVIQRLEDANAGGFFHCEADREEAIEIVAEEISAALASTAGAGAGDWVTVPREPTHDMLVAGYTAYAEAEWDAGRAKRGPERDSLPIAFRAMLAKAPAVPASPRSGAGDDLEQATADRIKAGLEVFQASPRTGAGEGEEASLGWLFHNPDTGTEWSLGHPVESGEVPDAEEIRPATLTALKDEMLSAWQGLEEEREAHALSARERNLFATEARALSPPAPAEHGAEIRELHAALSKGHALLCESGPDRCWVKIGFGWLKDAQDAHGALARFIKDGVPAALPPLTAAFSFPQPQRSRMYDVLRQLGQAAIRSQKITDHDAASAAQRECLSEIEALVSEALSQGGEAGRSEKGEGEEKAWTPVRTVAYLQQELERLRQDLRSVGEDLTDDQPKAVSWVDVAYGRAHNCISVLNKLAQRLDAPAQSPSTSDASASPHSSKSEV